MGQLRLIRLAEAVRAREGRRVEKAKVPIQWLLNEEIEIIKG